nr:MAG: GDSL-like Lipase/Acylhydrolase family protein [Bacteriophage sp.]
MSTTQHTGHYNLPTFGDNPNDRPSWRGDFTDAMTKIDNQMYANATNTTTATAAANNATTAASKATEAASKATEAASGAQSTANEAVARLEALGATSNTTAGQLKTKIDNTATDLDTLENSFNSFKTTTNGNIAALQKKDTQIAGDLSSTTLTANANKSDIAGINANLNALHANSVSDAESLYNIIAKPRMADPRKARIVCIGDSYGQGYTSSNETQNNPYAVMGRILGAEIHNFSDGGAGFIAQGTTNRRNYSGQIDYAATTVDSPDTVDFVMITGGQNDTSSVTSAVKKTIENARNKFPNAQIVVYPCQWTACQVWDTLLQRYAEISQGCSQAGAARFVEFGYELNLGEWQWIASDDKHPNDAGYAVMGAKFANVLMGDYGGTTKTMRPLSYGSGVSGGSRDLVSLDHGTITVQMSLTVASAVSGAGTLATLPKFITINDNKNLYQSVVNNKGASPTVVGFVNPTRTADGKITAPYGAQPMEIFIGYTLHL